MTRVLVPLRRRVGVFVLCWIGALVAGLLFGLTGANDFRVGHLTGWLTAYALLWLFPALRPWRASAQEER